MALSKKRVIDVIEIVGTAIQIRYKDRVTEDGVEIAYSYHRETIGPLDSTTGKDQLVQDIAVLIHTPEVIAAARAKLLEG